MGVCQGMDAVIHLASHPEAIGRDADEWHYQLSVNGTRALLEEASSVGVGCFVYTSSVKAIGELTQTCADESVQPRPVSGYGWAKLAAEKLVLEGGWAKAMQTSVLRLPIVYGSNLNSNLMRMIAAVDRGRFPPLPEVGNKRSMVHVDDVVQALLLAAENPAAAGQIYLVTDERAYSTREIYEAICRALGKPIPRWSVPVPLLRAAAAAGDLFRYVSGRTLPLNRSALEKLLGSAWYSSDKIRRELGFRPTRTLESALPEMVSAYRAWKREGAMDSEKKAGALS